jgi:hypothetical protein
MYVGQAPDALEGKHDADKFFSGHHRRDSETSRVTRWCEFSPIGRLFTFGQGFLKIAKLVHIVWLLFSTVMFIILTKMGLAHSCQMVCFQTKNPNLDKFWKSLDWKMLIYFMDI